MTRRRRSRHVRRATTRRRRVRPELPNQLRGPRRLRLQVRRLRLDHLRQPGVRRPQPLDRQISKRRRRPGQNDHRFPRQDQAGGRHEQLGQPVLLNRYVPTDVTP
jgi:hypothetical protein